MRDLAILVAVYAALPVIAVSPFTGLLVYSWLAYMRPQDMAWGVTKELPLSEWVAIALAVGLVVSIGRERLLAVRPQTVLLVLLAAWISVTVVTAAVPEMSAEVYGHYWKAVAVALVTTGLVRSRRRLRILLLLVAFSIGFLGVKHGVFGLVRGGVRFDHGPGGLMKDNNSFALGLNMALPLLVAIATTDRQRWIRLAAAGTALLSLLTIFFTFSRGGLLTLAVVGALLVWRTRQRAVAAALLLLGCAGFAVLTRAELKDEYFDRAETITAYEEDASARGRMDAWVTSWRVFRDYPVFGVGPNNLAVVYERYSPNPERFRVSHNAYLQLLSEAGLPGLLLFLTALGTALWRLDRLRRRAGDRRDPWVETHAHMLQIALVAYATGSMFLNMAYFELFYHLVGITVSLELAAAAPAGEAAAAPGAAAAEPPWWKRPRELAASPGRG